MICSKRMSRNGERRVIKSFWLIYKNSNGEQKEKIEASSKKEAKAKAEHIKEKILNYDETACDFQLYEQKITLERVKPSPKNWIP